LQAAQFFYHWLIPSFEPLRLLLGLHYKITRNKNLLKMKLLKIVFLLAFGLSLFTSCKKDKDPVTVPSSQFAGIYVGKYATGNTTPIVFFSFNIKQNGTLDELDETGQVIGTGTWTLNGNTFKATSQYVSPATNVFALIASYDASSKKLTGTWGYGHNDKDGGKWHMTKK
jgi:hypothetical protein